MLNDIRVYNYHDNEPLITRMEQAKKYFDDKFANIHTDVDLTEVENKIDTVNTNIVNGNEIIKEIRKTTQFKKDFKRISKDIKKVEALLEIVRMLAEGKVLPKENKPHPLGGDYKNHMECHIGDDYLLIWYDKEKDIIKLVRLGSHSELFGNNRKR